MPETQPFEKHPDRYDDWFDEHPAAYESELAAIRELWPEEGVGLEIGVGTGRFAGPLGIQHGVDKNDLLEGCDVGSMKGLARWTLAADKVINY